MSNTGTSQTFQFKRTIDLLYQTVQGKTESFKLNNNKIKAPDLTNNFNSSKLATYTCPFPDIAFEKIVLPQYDGIAQRTAKISNEPDYIKDYHIISLMRCIDIKLESKFQAIIHVHTNSPIFGTLNRG